MAAQAHQVDEVLSRPFRHDAGDEEAWQRSQAVLRRYGRRSHLPDAAFERTEITGPSALKLFVSSSTADADFFIVLRVFTGDMKEVVFQGAIDPHTPVAQGWLRASHRKLDKKLSTPYRPYHTHDEKQPLKKGQVAEIDVEIWPTSIAVPAGYRIGLSVRGKDYVYPGGSGGNSNFKNELIGCGPFLHDDPRDRPPELFDGITTLHVSASKAPYVLLPIVPPKPRPGKTTLRKR